MTVDALGLRAVQAAAWRQFAAIVCMMVLAVVSSATRPVPDSYMGFIAMFAHLALTTLLGFSAQRAYDLWTAIRTSADDMARNAGGEP